MANKRLGMVIDLERCVGCWTCATSCKANNNVGMGNWWLRILNIEGNHIGSPGDVMGAPVLNTVPFMCQHCENAPCVKSCPVGATYQRGDGVVMQDPDLCIGCRTCMAACPYNVKVFNWSDPVQAVELDEGEHLGFPNVKQRGRHVVEKCTFCAERLDAGEQPACVEACVTLTRTFGDLNDPTSEVSRLIRERNGFQVKPEFGTNPGVWYLPRRQRNQHAASTDSYGGQSR
jgi:molybdopterin-containing oxidoreductase family iron-sulfur binding subunit